jgi:GNAT superfamily N-acetyltransferase
MAQVRRSSLQKRLRGVLRAAFGMLPTAVRFPVLRSMIDCDPAPDARLELKIAETKEELEACFRLLHDAYVSSGFMKPHPSGMRITQYHALPTTTTLCAKYEGRVVGTMSMIREGVFGFPLQAIFDLDPLRSEGGKIAEISALAVHPDFRKTGGWILFPLMKFMYQYCTKYFDTRHLVIAVNPDKIQLYEALLFFRRMQQKTIEGYDFANGAPAVVASLDLRKAPHIFREAYKGRSLRKNLYKYFVELTLPNIRLPQRRYHTTNDPVMTPELLDYFFNQQSDLFASLEDRKKSLLWSIYTMAEYRPVLPLLELDPVGPVHVRQHQRFSLRCPGVVTFPTPSGPRPYILNVIEVSLSGFQAECKLDVEVGQEGEALIELGENEKTTLKVSAVRKMEGEGGVFVGFKLAEPDRVWRECVAALEVGHTSYDLMM